jgi:hypothetical protein
VWGTHFPRIAALRVQILAGLPGLDESSPKLFLPGRSLFLL